MDYPTMRRLYPAYRPGDEALYRPASTSRSDVALPVTVTAVREDGILRVSGSGTELHVQEFELSPVRGTCNRYPLRPALSGDRRELRRDPRRADDRLSTSLRLRQSAVRENARGFLRDLARRAAALPQDSRSLTGFAEVAQRQSITLPR